MTPTAIVAQAMLDDPKGLTPNLLRLAQQALDGDEEELIALLKAALDHIKYQETT